MEHASDRVIKRRILVMALFSSLLVAGCIGASGEQVPDVGPDASDAQAPEGVQASSSGEQGPDDEPPLATQRAFPNATTSSAASVEDLFVGVVEADQPAAVGAFEWVVPEGAEVEPTFYEQEDSVVVLEGIVTAESAQALEGLALFVFNLEGSSAEIVGGFMQVPAEYSYTINGDSGEGVVDPEPGPFTMHLRGSSVSEGDRLGFVFAAEAGTSTPTGFAFRVLEDDPGVGHEPPETYEELEEASGAIAPVALTLEGTGTGLHGAIYIETNRITETFRYESQDVTVEDSRPVDLRPFATAAAERRISSSWDTDAGWSSATLVHLIDNGASRWEASLDLHGTSLEADGVMANARHTALGPASMLAFGVPVALSTQEGPGPAGASLSVELPIAQGEMLTFGHTGIGEPIESLLGVAAEQDQFVFEGFLEEPPEPAQVHISPTGDLVLSGPEDAPLAVRLGPGAPSGAR